MSNDTIATVVGNITADPELRYTGNRTAVCNFTVASTPRFFKDGSWHDGEPLFMRCTVWREPAENVAPSLSKGDRVIVTGRLRQKSYDKDGERRTSIELDVDEVGPSLRYATVKVTKAEAKSGRGSGGRGGASDDPWSNAPKGGGGSSDYDEEPPF